jgi:hypothetical protein
MLPLTFLATMLAFTGGALLVNALSRSRRAAVLRDLAKSWQMRYVGRDPFHLALKISRRFPIPGAADLVVADLVYGSEPGRHRYIFTVQYTQGVVRTKSRRWCVATFSEPRDDEQGEPSALELAPRELAWIEQYEHLRASTRMTNDEIRMTNQ